MTRARLLLWLAEKEWLPRKWRDWLYATSYRLLTEQMGKHFTAFTKALGMHLLPAMKQAVQAMADFYQALVEQGYTELLDQERADSKVEP
jgi:hypothetical protein